MQKQKNNTTSKYQYLFEFDVIRLEQHIKTLQFDKIQYNEIILEIFTQFQKIKQQLEEVQKQNLDQKNRNQNTDFSIVQQQLDLLFMNMIQSKQIGEISTKQIMEKIQGHMEAYETLIQNLQENNQQLVLKLMNLSQVSQKIFPDGIEKSEFFDNLEKLWGEVCQSSKNVQEKLQKLMHIKPENKKNNTTFLQCQNKSYTQERANDLEKLKLEFMDVQGKAKIFKQFMEKQQLDKDQNTKSTLKQVFVLVTYNEQMIQRSLDLINELVQELKRQNQQTNQLLEHNHSLTKNIQKITQEHNKQINNLHKKFEKTKEDLLKQSSNNIIRSNYMDNKLKELSDFSLNIHKKFAQRVENQLQDLAISFMNILVQNIIVSYLQGKTQIQSDKKQAIQETERFLNQLKNQENKNMNDLISNCKKFLSFFQNQCFSSRDQQLKSFIKNFISSQGAFQSLQNYLEAIDQGIIQFIEDHNRLKQQENQS